jgi:hypothetical protein
MFQRSMRSVSPARKDLNQRPITAFCRSARTPVQITSIPAALRISQTMDGATRMPNPANPPWTRRQPQDGIPNADRTTNSLAPR